MKYKIIYAAGQCHNYASDRRDLATWLQILKDEVIIGKRIIQMEENQ